MHWRKQVLFTACSQEGRLLVPLQRSPLSQQGNSAGQVLLPSMQSLNDPMAGCTGFSNHVHHIGHHKGSSGSHGTAGPPASRSRPLPSNRCLRHPRRSGIPATLAATRFLQQKTVQNLGKLLNVCQRTSGHCFRYQTLLLPP